MASTEDLIDFNVIESHKENIEALPSGRSAKALARLYSPPLLGAIPSPQDAHASERAQFEQELASIDEADDPLDVYDRYVRWTLDAYPSPQARQTQLLPLLERATKSFQSSSHYRNDPRYLKLWLHYIRLFSDAPRETFIYLARHGIGDNLALYYEEFAAWLESAGRWGQAEEVYKLGLEKEARPVERLLRKFGEFERRMQARPEDAIGPSSPALSVARPALAAKVDPFASASPLASTQQPQVGATKKGKSSKMAIFSDGDEVPRSLSDSGAKGWDNIGTISERKKENSREAKPWVGEKLKGGKTNGGMEKLMVFKDESLSTSQTQLPTHMHRSVYGNNNGQQCVRNPKNGRLECVFVNLDAVYPKPGQEFCFEELRSRHRRWLHKDWRHGNSKAQQTQAPGLALSHRVDQRSVDGRSVDMDQPKADTSYADVKQASASRRQKGFKIYEESQEERASPKPREHVSVSKALSTHRLDDENAIHMPPPKGDADLVKKLRREERANRTRKIQVMDVKHIKNETRTIQLNLDSPVGPKLRRKKSTDRTEPTMTINTREAMDEIYGIFNQPLPSQTEHAETEGEDSEDDCTTGDESTNTGKLSATASEFGDDTKNELLGASTGRAAESDDRTDNTGWSDFTRSKHVPQDVAGSAPESAQSTTWEVYEDQSHSAGPEDEDELVTPQEEHQRIHGEIGGAEEYEQPVTQQVMLPNHRLPFMTPIVEQTESSLGATTARSEKDYFSTKTPSRRIGVPLPELEDDEEEEEEAGSSPFQERTGAMSDEKRKVLQPIRTKTTKGTISLGQGTAKSQIAARSDTTAAPDSLPKGPIIKEAQCNPMDPVLRQTVLAQVKPSLSTYDGYNEHLDQTCGRTAEIRKFVKALAKSSKSSVHGEKTGHTPSLPPTISCKGADGIYTIKRELGAGTFAPVYLIENSAATPTDAEVNDENRPPSRLGKSAYRRHLEAVKMEDPPNAWEFYIIRQAHRRLGITRAAESIVRAHEFHLYRDECFLIEEYRGQGTLLDLVNLARADATSGNSGMDEMLAMWLTVEVLRTVEALHSKQLIHGDLKGDNVLVRFDDPGPETDWSPTYFPSGAHGWASKGICLIDFGRGIDMRQFVPHVAFIADWKTSEADCAEMRELRPWTYQIDYHGVAGVIHSLLFGKYMETVGEKGGSSGRTTLLGPGVTKTYRIRETLKRYWQTEIWSETFALLLNPLAHVEGEEGKKLPVLKGMRRCRERMEAWLEENCEKGVGLKGQIVKMEAAIRDRRRKSAKAA